MSRPSVNMWLGHSTRSVFVSEKWYLESSCFFCVYSTVFHICKLCKLTTVNIQHSFHVIFFSLCLFISVTLLGMNDCTLVPCVLSSWIISHCLCYYVDTSIYIHNVFTTFQTTIFNWNLCVATGKHAKVTGSLLHTIHILKWNNFHFSSLRFIENEVLKSKAISNKILSTV